MNFLKQVVLAIDRWQRRHRAVAVTYAVIKKFGDDQANLLVVALGWYGFTAIYPLLLVVVTVLGFIGEGGLGKDVVSTLHQFPVIGTDFNPGQGSAKLHGSVAGLVIGAAGLLYGAQGVTQTAQSAMAQVWNVPRVHLPGFLSRLGRSLLGLAVIGGAFILNAALGSVAVGNGPVLVERVALIGVLLFVNIGCYFVAFLTLTPPNTAKAWQLLPGAIVGAVGFTLLTTVGTGLVQHQLRHTTATYGAFASVIGVVAYLLLLAKLTVYSAELNPVLALELWPRALPMADPTEADNKVLHKLAHQEQRRPDQRIGVGFEPDPATEAAHDARGSDGGRDWSIPARAQHR
ncbi:MAG: YihY/virulence factor BrkB family protein [Actinomycetota bacterium]|nr:YihY/virulence factor BrkB family protein [Actinomycetota bacterium]